MARAPDKMSCGHLRSEWTVSLEGWSHCAKCWEAVPATLLTLAANASCCVCQRSTWTHRQECAALISAKVNETKVFCPSCYQAVVRMVEQWQWTRQLMEQWHDQARHQGDPDDD